MIFIQFKILCITCNRDLQEALYNDEFLPNFFTLISGFLVLAFIVAVLTFFSFRRHKKNLSQAPGQPVLNPVPLSTTSLILGIGIGGFIDGIVFHQILQWHGMLSNRIGTDTLLGKSVNMFWDGIFHAFTLIAVIIGVASLILLINRKNINSSPGLAWGGGIAGWGLFNLVEGTIHHQILKLHNVNEFSLNQDLWNLGFLASGVLFMIIGGILMYLYSEDKSIVQEKSIDQI